jgi:hypothetical protein
LPHTSPGIANAPSGGKWPSHWRGPVARSTTGHRRPPRDRITSQGPQPIPDARRQWSARNRGLRWSRKRRARFRGAPSLNSEQSATGTERGRGDEMAVTTRYGRGSHLLVGRRRAGWAWMVLACGDEPTCWSEHCFGEHDAIWPERRILPVAEGMLLIDGLHRGTSPTARPERQGSAGYERKMIRCSR